MQTNKHKAVERLKTINVIENENFYLFDDIVDFEAKIEEYLMLFGIIQYQNKYIHQLSKGTKQKALIIKTLLSNADVFLLDEPLSGLDNKSRIVFMSLIKELQNKEIASCRIEYIQELKDEEFYLEYSFEGNKVLAKGVTNKGTHFLMEIITK